MINMKQGIILVTFFLTACVPVKTSPTIVIYNSTSNVTQAPSKDGKPKTVSAVTCKDVRVVRLADYELPAKPDLSNIPDGDDEAVVNALLEHIHLLRHELSDVAKDYGCRVNASR